MERGGLTPEGIATKRFKLSRRGYNPDEVSEFLAEVAAAYQGAVDKAAAHQTPKDHAQSESFALSFEQLGAEAGALMQTAKEGADSLRRRAEGEAAAIVGQATHEAEERMREVTLETERLRNATKRQCEEMISEAQGRSDRLKAHERKMREKVAELEQMFLAFRNEMAASTSTDEEALDTPAADESGEEANQAHGVTVSTTTT